MRSVKYLSTILTDSDAAMKKRRRARYLEIALYEKWLPFPLDDMKKASKNFAAIYSERN